MKGVAIITGGSEGIGYSIAEMFVRRGFSVGIVARRPRLLKHAADALEKIAYEVGENGKVYWESVDLANVDETFAYIERSAQALGGIDVIVNNAATVIKKPFAEMTLDDLRVVALADILAPWVCVNAALPYLLKSPYHTVINIGSEMDVQPLSEFVSYSSAKAAMTGFTRALSAEYSSEQLRVHGIKPRRVQTSLWDRVRSTDAAYFIPSDVASMVEELVFTNKSAKNGEMLTLNQWKQPV